MAHRFVVRIGTEILEFHDYDQIPPVFDLLMEFSPEIPAGPHTPEQHAEIDAWLPKFERLMERERASRREKR